MSKEVDDSSVLALTARIVSAHVANNSVQSEGLPNLIQLVYAALANAGTEVVEAEKPMPAVPIKRSVFPDYIICLEDGKKLKMLKRHLDASYNMTPAQYRDRWGLPADYPMVAPNYAERRSALAKQIGLGRKPTEPVEEPVKTPAKRGRKAKEAA
jgi:predicted transcriptional regulator